MQMFNIFEIYYQLAINLQGGRSAVFLVHTSNHALLSYFSAYIASLMYCAMEKEYDSIEVCTEKQHD